MDLRNSGFKLAPVDTNLFPGGFNNLNPDFLPLCVQAAMTALEKVCPEARGVLLIPENHTRNTFYLQNVAVLQIILRRRGHEGAHRHADPGDHRSRPRSRCRRRHAAARAARANGQPHRAGRTSIPVSCCSTTICRPASPTILREHRAAGDSAAVRRLVDAAQVAITSPPTSRVAEEFANADRHRSLARSNPYFGTCGEINFQERTGEDCLAGYVETVLDQIRRKYEEYGIDREPFVIVKADAGTYGMGIMTVKSPDDVRDLNRKQRNKMAVVKEGLQVHRRHRAGRRLHLREQSTKPSPSRSST